HPLTELAAVMLAPRSIGASDTQCMSFADRQGRSNNLPTLEALGLADRLPSIEASANSFSFEKALSALAQKQTCAVRLTWRQSYSVIMHRQQHALRMERFNSRDPK